MANKHTRPFGVQLSSLYTAAVFPWVPRRACQQGPIFLGHIYVTLQPFLWAVPLLPAPSVLSDLCPPRFGVWSTAVVQISMISEVSFVFSVFQSPTSKAIKMLLADVYCAWEIGNGNGLCTLMDRTEARRFVVPYFLTPFLFCFFLSIVHSRSCYYIF